MGFLRRLLGGAGRRPQAPVAAACARVAVVRPAAAPLDLAHLCAQPSPEETPATSQEQALCGWIAGRTVERWQRSSEEPPAFPALAARIFEVLEHPDPDPSDVVQLIAQDPLVAAQVLKMANSAFHAGVSTVTTVRDAVVRVGLKQVAAVAAAASSRAIFDVETRSTDQILADDWERLWLHSLASAFSAGFLSARLRLALDRLFLGGLMHDVGKTAALRGLGALCASGELGFTPSPRIVAQVIELAYMPLGAALAERWCFPPFLRGLLAAQHRDDLAKTEAETHAVRAASGLDELLHDARPRPALLREVRQSLDALGLGPAGERALVSEVREAGARAAALGR